MILNSDLIKWNDKSALDQAKHPGKGLIPKVLKRVKRIWRINYELSLKKKVSKEHSLEISSHDSHFLFFISTGRKYLFNWGTPDFGMPSDVDRLTVSLHSPNGRPVMRSVQGDCKSCEPTIHFDRGNPNIFLNQPITMGWCQPIGGHIQYPVKVIMTPG